MSAGDTGTIQSSDVIFMKGAPLPAHNPDGPMRLQKFLAARGGSRRACEALIAAGCSGQRPSWVLGESVMPAVDCVLLDGVASSAPAGVRCCWIPRGYQHAGRRTGADSMICCRPSVRSDCRALG